MLPRARELLPEIEECLHYRDDLLPQSNDPLWFLDVGFFTDLTAKLNEFNTERQCKKKMSIKMVRVSNSFKGKLNLRKT
jgi:hypothetical protein